MPFLIQECSLELDYDFLSKDDIYNVYKQWTIIHHHHTCKQLPDFSNNSPLKEYYEIVGE